MRTTSEIKGGPASRSRRAGQWLRRAFGIFLRIDGTQRAGAFAHFAFFSLFPTIILMVTAASLVLDRERATREVIAFIEDYVPLGADREGYILSTIEGVAATGNRTTTIIPAGQIGNVQEIRVVSEQWFSDDLQVLVLTRHTDPRSGENIYRLKNIVRAEPDPSLFAPPADYTIQDRNVRRPQ